MRFKASSTATKGTAMNQVNQNKNFLKQMKDQRLNLNRAILNLNLKAIKSVTVSMTWSILASVE
jgi:hypothetical protein